MTQIHIESVEDLIDALKQVKEEQSDNSIVVKIAGEEKVYCNIVVKIPTDPDYAIELEIF